MTTRDETIDIAVDDHALAGTLVRPDTLVPGVLFVHGWGGSQAQYLARARQISALGCICLTFDLTGHAATEEARDTVSRERNLRDVLAAYDVLARQAGVDASAIAVVGSSYGGYLAAILTTMRPVRWLALRAPALYIDSGWQVPKLQLHKDQDLQAYRRSVVQPGDNRALQACAAFKGDALIVESERDTVVPQPVIKSYVEAFIKTRSLTYRVIEGADHGLSEEGAQRAYTTLLTNWIGEMVGGARGGNEAGPVAAAGEVPEAPPTPG
jgi:pimeloyl-ACP methyl ester carboxylesterase